MNNSFNKFDNISNNIPIVNLVRILKNKNQGTLGMLFYNNFLCYTMELPWNDNKRNISHIPNGQYKCIFKKSPKFGFVYHLQNVPNRSYILIHSGNWAGNYRKGFYTHTYGCILLGQYKGTLMNQMAVLNSRVTIRKFINIMNKEPFILNIVGF